MKQCIYKRYKIGLLLLLALPLFFTACIFDNLDYCPANVSLRFLYTLNIQDEDLFDQQVDSVDLFIYKEDGSFVRKITKARRLLDNDNTLELSLLKGNYKVVVWAHNGLEHYSLTDIDNYEKMRLKVLSNENAEVDNNLGRLFHGAIDLSLEPTVVYPTQDIALVKNTNDIRIVLKRTIGPPTMKLGDYSVAIKGSNGEYNSKNESVSDLEYNYMPSYSMMSGNAEIHVDFKVLRLFKDDNLRLIIHDRNGDLVFEGSLTEQILKAHPLVNTNEDLDRYDKYQLIPKFDENGTVVVFEVDIKIWDKVEGSAVA